MKDLDLQGNAYHDFVRLVHGIESNKQHRLDVASKVQLPNEHLRSLDMVIKAQEALLKQMLRNRS